MISLQDVIVLEENLVELWHAQHPGRALATPEPMDFDFEDAEECPGCYSRFSECGGDCLDGTGRNFYIAHTMEEETS